MNFKPKKMRNMGLIGLAIVLVLNAIGYMGLNQPAALLFSENWWSTWAPSYLVWLVITTIGFGGSLRTRSH